ncbi:MAG: hypothetical protein G3I10_00775 [Ferrovum sp.]|nr:hypothetical protein [Ferrovum sp.]
MKSASVKKPVILTEQALRFASGAAKPKASAAKSDRKAKATVPADDNLLTLHLSRETLKKLKKTATRKGVGIEALVAGWIEKHL